MANAKSKKLRRYSDRAHELVTVLGLDRIEPIVGLKSEEQTAIEWVTHELSHALTLGFHTFVTDLSQQVNNVMERLSLQTQDSLESDTAWLTYQALRALQIVTAHDRERIASVCAGSLSDVVLSGRTYYVLDQFAQRDDHVGVYVEAFSHNLETLKHCFQKPTAWVLREYVPGVRTEELGQHDARGRGPSFS